MLMPQTPQTPQNATETDPCMKQGAPDDEVVQLREWGSHRAHRLPRKPESPLQVDWLVGAGAGCATRLTDLTGRISAHHARLLWDRGHWCLLDIGSKNGLRVDGSLQASALLTPGTEVTIGGLTLLAESPRLIRVRAFLSRLLGWAPERLGIVDEALRAIRLMQAHRAPLVLRGEGDWVTVARDLHHRVFGADRPFVLCAPRGSSMDANLRGIVTVDQGCSAIAAARGGSLCIRSNRPPVELVKIVAMLRSPSARVQLILCDDLRTDAPSALALPITIPSLLSRYEELPRVIDEYCRDAAAALGTRIDSEGEVRAWILRNASSTIPDIERAAYRLFAIRRSKTLAEAAELLGLEARALRGWLDRANARHVASGEPRAAGEALDDA